MRVIRGILQLNKFLAGGSEKGCLADTGFLYAASYLDDRLHTQAVEVFEIFAHYDVQIYSNVISRMEFIG
jgi:hypothetical protein